MGTSESYERVRQYLYTVMCSLMSQQEKKTSVVTKEMTYKGSTLGSQRSGTTRSDYTCAMWAGQGHSCNEVMFPSISWLLLGHSESSPDLDHGWFSFAFNTNIFQVIKLTGNHSNRYLLDTVTLTDCFSRVQRVLTDWLQYWQCTKTAWAYPGITPYVYFLFYLVLCSLLRGSRFMYCTEASNGWWERFWSALGSCMVQEISVAEGSTSEALQACEQYMETFTPLCTVQETFTLLCTVHGAPHRS